MLTPLQIQLHRPEFPEIKFDLRERVIGPDPTKESYNINILEIEERSHSTLAQLKIHDRSLATVDEDGVLTYTPLGNYFGNQLRIRYQATVPQRTATIDALEKRQVYQPPAETEVSTEETVEGEIEVRVSNKVIGVENANDHFVRQSGPTCFIAAIAGALKGSGIDITYQELLELVTIEVDAEGNQLGENADITNKDGQAVYQRHLKSDGSWEVSRQKLGQTGINPRLKRKLTFDEIHGKGYAPGIISDRGLMENIEKHFNVNIDTGSAYSFFDIIKPLEEGKPVMALIDSKEFGSTYVKRQADISDKEESPNGETGSPVNYSGNHMINITGFRTNDEGKPEFRVNDSGSGAAPQTPGVPAGQGRWVSAEQMAAAMGDAQFTIYTVGEHPNAEQQKRRDEIEDRIQGGLLILGDDNPESLTFKRAFVEYQVVKDDGTIDPVIPSEAFGLYVRTPGFVNALEELYPGTKMLVAEYLRKEKEQLDYLKEEYELDPVKEKEVYKATDVIDWAEGVIRVEN